VFLLGQPLHDADAFEGGHVRELRMPCVDRHHVAMAKTPGSSGFHLVVGLDVAALELDLGRLEPEPPSPARARPPSTACRRRIVFDSPDAVRNATSTPLDVLSAASVLAPVWIVMYFREQLAASIEISSVLERQHARRQLDHGHGRAEAAKNEATRSPPRRRRSDQAAGDLLQLQDLVGREDGSCRRWRCREGLRGARAGASRDGLARELGLALSPFTTTVRPPSSRPVPEKNAILFFLKR